MKNRNYNLAVGVLLALAPVNVAFSQDIGADADLELPPNAGHLQFSGGVDYTTDYYFRGIIQEDDGFILQP